MVQDTLLGAGATRSEAMAATAVPVDATILGRERRSRRGARAGGAEERPAHRLAACPAVLYSFRARDDFAPTFIGDSLRDLLGHQPAEYLRNAEFWRERVHPRGSGAGRGRGHPSVRRRPACRRVPLPQGRRQLLPGERRAAADLRRAGRACRGGGLLERHHRDLRRTAGAVARHRAKCWPGPGSLSVAWLLPATDGSSPPQ